MSTELRYLDMGKLLEVKQAMRCAFNESNVKIE